ncbi:hypothetical protein COCSUDRAFT_46447 [Coccomyxa subellipsoidea C-169]|uniref:LUC7-domain-containing protein n=1 Tax=Coccomyxa subellipsoidea (strain C-169) TaxID=574566 RepID=I0Z5Q5_COCSC|nr:hypothetical protein COCSUDRAFT_46447 [Coccomyxa subellipsoidea C-169]EIE25974.1 hypothetical protein COCSUDRAFT_46447 [Coccomyxa subellipsoidea C-169]|eukprot:XP_005650518.1 hypothetical protein COCSUDRAFT_46447 [Coccomyxa subellipsoidea C-169]
MCPYEEFERTKHDFGACPLIHDDDLKAQWEDLDDRSRERLGFEKELYKWIDKLMLELKAKIRRNEERVASEMAPPISLEDQRTLDEMAAELQEMLTRSEVRRAAFEEEAAIRAGGGPNRYGQQEVCPLSGVIINKEESRLRDHKNGKNYRTWCKTHEKYNELMEIFKRRDAERDGSSRSSRPRDGGSSRDRPRDREKDRDRERDRVRDKDRDRDRERHRDRDRERDRDRDRDRDRKKPRRERDELF